MSVSQQDTQFLKTLQSHLPQGNYKGHSPVKAELAKCPCDSLYEIEQFFSQCKLGSKFTTDEAFEFLVRGHQKYVHIEKFILFRNKEKPDQVIVSLMKKKGNKPYAQDIKGRVFHFGKSHKIAQLIATDPKLLCQFGREIEFKDEDPDDQDQEQADILNPMVSRPCSGAPLTSDVQEKLLKEILQDCGGKIDGMDYSNKTYRNALDAFQLAFKKRYEFKSEPQSKVFTECVEGFLARLERECKRKMERAETIGEASLIQGKYWRKIAEWRARKRGEYEQAYTKVCEIMGRYPAVGKCRMMEVDLTIRNPFLDSVDYFKIIGKCLCQSTYSMARQIINYLMSRHVAVDRLCSFDDEGKLRTKPFEQRLADFDIEGMIEWVNSEFKKMRGHIKEFFQDLKATYIKDLLNDSKERKDSNDAYRLAPEGWHPIFRSTINFFYGDEFSQDSSEVPAAILRNKFPELQRLYNESKTEKQATMADRFRVQAWKLLNKFYKELSTSLSDSMRIIDDEFNRYKARLARHYDSMLSERGKEVTFRGGIHIHALLFCPKGIPVYINGTVKGRNGKEYPRLWFFDHDFAKLKMCWMKRTPHNHKAALAACNGDHKAAKDYISLNFHHSNYKPVYDAVGSYFHMTKYMTKSVTSFKKKDTDRALEKYFGHKQEIDLWSKDQVTGGGYLLSSEELNIIRKVLQKDLYTFLKDTSYKDLHGKRASRNILQHMLQFVAPIYRATLEKVVQHHDQLILWSKDRYQDGGKLFSSFEVTLLKAVLTTSIISTFGKRTVSFSPKLLDSILLPNRVTEKTNSNLASLIKAAAPSPYEYLGTVDARDLPIKAGTYDVNSKEIKESSAILKLIEDPPPDPGEVAAPGLQRWT